MFISFFIILCTAIGGTFGYITFDGNEISTLICSFIGFFIGVIIVLLVKSSGGSSASSFDLGDFCDFGGD